MVIILIVAEAYAFVQIKCIVLNLDSNVWPQQRGEKANTIRYNIDQSFNIVQNIERNNTPVITLHVSRSNPTPTLTCDLQRHLPSNTIAIAQT